MAHTDKDKVTSLALKHGFKLKEQPDGTMALNPYVFEFAEALAHSIWCEEVNADGMAECMYYVRQELIEADVIGKDIAPMFIPEAVIEYGKNQYKVGRVAAHRATQEQAVGIIKALQAERDHWKANHADMVKRAGLLLQREDLPVDRLPAYREMEVLQKALQAKQAEIDRLMLEFCPGEMTAEQMEEWERHQRKVPE